MKTVTTIVCGEDLSDFGIEQLEERKISLEGEILRINQILQEKKIGRKQAEKFFKTM